MPNPSIPAAGGALPAEGRTSRRLFLAAGSAAAVFATVKHAAGSAGPVDPIFAAIDRHKLAFDAFCATCSRTDNVRAEQEGREVTEADEAAYAAASDAVDEATAALIQTPPQTVAGMRSAIEWLVKYDEGCLPQTSGYFLAALLESPVLAEGRANV